MKIFNIGLFTLIALATLQVSAQDNTATKAKPTNTTKNSPISIAAIDVDIFDRVTGKTVGEGEPSDPYGMLSDVFVKVKIKKIKVPETENAYLTVKLTATTPQTDDEARGITEATKQVVSTKAHLSYDTDITNVPFLVDFKCNPMTFTVEIVELKIKKSVTKEYGCAE
ncbi:MAG TPA: hypothetical protein VN030_13605 [Cellvibrio sp.]|nr:hypothetical protein [Cellvibrio sp.]